MSKQHVAAELATLENRVVELKLELGWWVAPEELERHRANQEVEADPQTAREAVGQSEVFRVIFDTGGDDVPETHDFPTLDEAIRAVRDRYPYDVIGRYWRNLPPALNGDMASEVGFGPLQSAQGDGRIFHLRLTGHTFDPMTASAK